MSLINEALKRAKEAQNHGPNGGRDARAPLTRGLELRPVEPTPGARANRALFFPIVLTLTALAALFLLWKVQSQNSSSELIAAAASKPAALPTAATKPTGAGSPDQAARTEDVTRPHAAAEVKGTAAAASPGPAASTAGPSANASPAVAASGATRAAGTNATQGIEPPPPPPALRLQAIVFSSSRPWAMINGKTLYTGDRFGELRVLAIGRDHATLAGPAGTNVLTLPE
jgi:hypothetical protein